jgi:hypothetical protein
MFNSLTLEMASGVTLGAAAVLLTINDLIRQPSRGTRYHWTRSSKDIQHEKNMTVQCPP